MKKLGGLTRLDIANELRFIGHCEIKGCLYDLGDYPGLVLGDGMVIGELYRMTDLSIFNMLDTYERFDPNNQRKSLYLRTKVALINPDQHAWIYIYNQSVDSAERIESGDWHNFINNRYGMRD